MIANIKGFVINIIAYTKQKTNKATESMVLFCVARLQTFDQRSSKSEFAFIQNLRLCAYSYLTLFEILKMNAFTVRNLYKSNQF